MSDDVKADEVAAQLYEAFGKTIQQAVAGLPAHQALQLADTLCAVQQDVLAGLRVSYRSLDPIDGAAVAEAWARGASLREIMRDFRCSKASAYKFHPSKGRRVAAG
jgi:hypothetical protein